MSNGCGTCKCGKKYAFVKGGGDNIGVVPKSAKGKSRQAPVKPEMKKVGVYFHCLKNYDGVEWRKFGEVKDCDGHE